MNYKLTTLKNFTDNRGDLVVFLKNSELDKKSKQFGQIYLVTFNGKGAIRGNHYHRRWNEWFGIISGKVVIYVENVITKEQVRLIFDAKHDFGKRLEIGPGIAHKFVCLSKSAVLLNYADKEWRASDRIEYVIK